MNCSFGWVCGFIIQILVVLTLPSCDQDRLTGKGSLPYLKGDTTLTNSNANTECVENCAITENRNDNNMTNDKTADEINPLKLCVDGLVWINEVTGECASGSICGNTLTINAYFDDLKKLGFRPATSLSEQQLFCKF